MLNQGFILVLLHTIKKEATYIMVAEKVKRNGPIVLSWMQKARMTLVQPLVMAGRQSFSLGGNLE